MFSIAPQDRLEHRDPHALAGSTTRLLNEDTWAYALAAHSALHFSPARGGTRNLHVRIANSIDVDELLLGEDDDGVLSDLFADADDGEVASE